MSLVDGLGDFASMLVLTTFCMRGMVELRVLALASNVAFIAYAALAGIEPVLLLHALLVPMNAWRLLQIALQRRADPAGQGGLPAGKRVPVRPGLARLSDPPSAPDMTPHELLQHSDSGRPWPSGGGAGFSDLACAYQAALEVRALRMARGEVPRGYKIGFTNHTLWSRYDVFAPMWGSIWSTTVAQCDGKGALSLANLCQPRIEPEAVFGFKAVPPAGADLQQLFEAIDWIAPGFEVVQSHMPDWKFAAPQTVADSGLHGRLLVGRTLPVNSVAADAEQLHRVLAATRVTLRKNGSLVEEGSGANVLRSPLQALLHFLAELRSCPRATDIRAGDIVTTGTWTDAWPVRPGERWTATFDAALPSLEVGFEP